MKKDNVIWGLLFIILGVYIALRSLEIIHFSIFFNGWWTMFIIIPSFINVFRKEDKAGSLICLLVGAVLLLFCNDYIPNEILKKLIVPFILIAIGLAFMVGTKSNENVKKNKEKIKEMDMEDDITSFIKEEVINVKTFDGADLNSVFGTIKYDLRKAKIKKTGKIEATSVFGSITIIVPDDVNVEVETSTFVGEVINKVKNDKKNEKTIYIDAESVFGGVIIERK